MYKLIFAWGVALAALLTLSGCLKMENTYTKLPPGAWRAVLHLDPSTVTPNPKGQPLAEKMNLTFEEVTNGELPFNFEVVYTDDTTFHVVLINGDERIVAKDVTFGRSPERAKDSVRINFPIYDTYLVGLYEEGIIQGEWVVNYRENYRIPFTARFGMDHRFTKIPKAPVLDLSGKWAVTFGPGGDEKNAFAAVGEFQQDGSQLKGTFRTETGDYRYLAGEVSGAKAYLSVFDGSHAFLFEAQIDPGTQTMVGAFRSGTTYKTIWQATRNPNATLADAYSMTQVRAAGAPFDFAFPNTQGDTVRLSDAAFDGKVKLVQLLGSWCPNCRDETQFLLDYLAANPNPDVQVIGIGFERYRDATKSLAALERLKTNMAIPYPILYGGYYDKAEAAAALPQLNQIVAYPTLLFVDKNNVIRKIHTGFDGPATSQHAAFKAEFEGIVREMLGE